MSENTPFADQLDKDGVQDIWNVSDAQTSGFPAPDPKPVEPTADETPGMPTTGTSDAGAEFEAKMAEMRANYERDMRGLKSSLQKTAAQERQEYEQRMSQMEQDLHIARTATMNDQERVTYERDVYAQRAQMLEDQARQYQQRLYDWEQAGQARAAFQQLGIDPSKLPQGTVDQVLQAGWKGVAERMAELELQAKAAQAAPRLVENQPAQPQQPGLVQPPATASAQGTPTGGRTWGDAYKAASDILGAKVETEEDLIRMVELGQLPPSILPGLG